MINFTNENIQKELKKKKRNVLISLGFTIAFIILIVFFSILEENEQEVNLTEKTSSGTKACLDVFTSPINFAYYENEDSAFYMVYATKDRERNLLAIIKMNESDYESLTDVSLENPKTVHGITASVPNDIKDLAMETLKDADLAVDNFTDGFYPVYLDLTGEKVSLMGTMMTLNVIFLVIALICLFLTIFVKSKYIKSLKKYSKEEITKLDEEMNDKNSLYYESSHLYLTNKNIIDLTRSIKVIPYEDIVWFYSYEIRQRGIKTARSIILKMQNGKSLSVAYLSSIGKKNNQTYEEIFKTIEQHCPNALVGYNKENEAKFKSLNSKS